MKKVMKQVIIISAIILTLVGLAVGIWQLVVLLQKSALEDSPPSPASTAQTPYQDIVIIPTSNYAEVPSTPIPQVKPSPHESSRTVIQSAEMFADASDCENTVVPYDNPFFRRLDDYSILQN